MSIHKPFEAAALALETIGSGLIELRTKFHYEVALCEMKKDTLAKVCSSCSCLLMILGYVSSG